MKTKFGAIVVDGRNKVGGHVASKNRAGSYFRTKVTPINPGTSYQVNVRNRLAGLSSAWRALEASERLAWNAVVADYARTDIFGDLRNPSGFNLHQMLNNNRINIGLPAITTPPMPEAVAAFTSLSIAALAETQKLTLTFGPAIDEDHRVLIRATPSISAGITFVKSWYRQIGVIWLGHASPFDAESYYTAKFGVIGAAGTKISVQLVQIRQDTGQSGIPIQASCIVGA